VKHENFRLKHATAAVAVIQCCMANDFIKQLAARSGSTRDSSRDTVMRLCRAISVDVAVKKYNPIISHRLALRFGARLMQR